MKLGTYISAIGLIALLGACALDAGSQDSAPGVSEADAAVTTPWQYVSASAFWTRGMRVKPNTYLGEYLDYAGGEWYSPPGPQFRWFDAIYFNELTDNSLWAVIQVSGLPAGTYGVQMHQSNDTGNHGAALGPIWNPSHVMGHHTFATHPSGVETGSLGNVVVDATGSGSLIIRTTRMKMEKIAEPVHFLPNSPWQHSVCVFSRPDDGITQPDGNVGVPLVCGGIYGTDGQDGE